MSYIPSILEGRWEMKTKGKKGQIEWLLVIILLAFITYIVGKSFGWW